MSKQNTAELNAIREYLWPNQTGLPNKHRDCLVAIKARERLASKNADRLLAAVQQAYRYHHLGHDHLTSIELGDILMCALCEAMGDKEFVAWLAQFSDEP